jgi:hypothetical protein
MELGSSGGNGVCEPLTMTADHVRSVWDGGQTVSGNIVAACYECNQARAQVTNRTPIRTEYDLASTAAVWRGMMPTERRCGSCSLCCRLPSIAALEKPIDTWCMHCRPGNGGCSIYADRPPACRMFNCGWLKPHIWNGLLLLTIDRCRAAEESYHRHRWLLRTRRERPRSCCAAQCEYDFSPSDVDCHATPPAGGLCACNRRDDITL